MDTMEDDFKLLADLTSDDLKTVTEKQLVAGFALRFIEFTTGIAEDLEVLARHFPDMFATLNMPEQMAQATRFVEEGTARAARLVRK
jgi:hypothetical protein